ncbi:MAG: UDP-3-O-[3-hydroxymyristoyl] glucosamine N-acyltransferase, partial [Luteibaculaceae bacterium]
KNTKIGANCSFFSGAQIYPETIIGNNCTIHSGTIIGADGFGFAPSNSEGYKKVPQIGNVILEDDVEIGANSCVDRATLGSTIIRKGVKLDNLVQIAHNVEIGAHTVIAAQTGVAGSTKIGENCMIGGQVGINGHITIADGCKIAAQAGVTTTIKEKNSVVQGSPAMPIGDFKRSYVLFKGLPQMRASLQKIEKKLTEIFENLAHE